MSLDFFHTFSDNTNTNAFIYFGSISAPCIHIILGLVKNKKVPILFFAGGDIIPIWKRLFAGTVPANKNLFAGTIPAKTYLPELVPANKNLFAGTPSVGSLNIFHLRVGFSGFDRS